LTEIERVKIDARTGGAVAIYFENGKFNICSTELPAIMPKKTLMINTTQFQLKNRFEEGSPFEEQTFLLAPCRTDGEPPCNIGGASVQKMQGGKKAFRWFIERADQESPDEAGIDLAFCEIVVDDDDVY